MGLRDRMGEVGKAARGVLDTDAARAAGRGASGLGKGAAAAAHDADDWISGQLQSVAPPALPLTEPWKLSLGALVARHPKAPRLTGTLLSPLDGFGAIMVGPGEIGFDGDEAGWDKVTEVRTRTISELACGAIWDFAVDDLRKSLPPVPGRKWAVTKVLQILMAMAVDLDHQVDSEEEDAPTRVVCEVSYRGLLRREKTASVGLFSGLVLCSMPQVSEALAGVALDRGVPVVEAEPYKGLSVNERVARMRARRSELQAQVRELRADDEDAPAAAAEAEAAGAVV